MGGPFWAKKDDAAWSIPKGLLDDGEQPLAAALREFEEELGIPAPDAAYEQLGEFRYSSGKIVTVFAAEADPPLDGFDPGTFQLELRGGLVAFPEIDRVQWFGMPEARVKLVKGQRGVLEALASRGAIS